MRNSKWAIILMITLFYACSKSKSEPFTTDCSTEKSYASDVSPLIAEFCATAGCHASGSNNGPGALTSYAQVYSARAAIRSSVSNGSMPENTTLTAAQKNAIICWIDAGASDN